jgi:hypothetical protein
MTTTATTTDIKKDLRAQQMITATALDLSCAFKSSQLVHRFPAVSLIKGWDIVIKCLL